MATSVNSAGVAHASGLIKAGKVNHGAWDFSADDGNALLGSGGDDWANYATAFLGIHADQPEKTKAHYGYPCIKGGEVYRRALAAAESRASAQGDDSVAAAAKKLFDSLPDEGKSAPAAVKRAYSTLEIKSIDNDQRIITGIASTPSTDRMGDIVESMGAQFKLPIPLLWQHNDDMPVGNVTAAQATADGIQITAQFASVDAPASLKDFLDSAWAQVKAKLVRGLSIGFLPLESSSLDGGKSMWGAQRFISWDWMELSCVTIPANQDATILTVKSIDHSYFKQSGVVRLGSTIPRSDKKKSNVVKVKKAGLVYLE